MIARGGPGRRASSAFLLRVGGKSLVIYVYIYIYIYIYIERERERERERDVYG